MSNRISSRAEVIADVADAVVHAHHELTEAANRLRSVRTTERPDDALLRRAAEADEAVVRLEADLMASAAVERSASEPPPDASSSAMGEALDDVARSWRTRADELLLQARLGRMDLTDAASDALVEFTVAGEDLAHLVAALRDEESEWTVDLRERSSAVVADLRAAVHTLVAAVRP
ncbi:MAG: hypothetical protein U0Q22_01840 [Acidimicrobiales bacterium]